MDYKSAGVDTEKAQGLIHGLKERIKSTYENNQSGKVLGAFGGFGGIFQPGQQFQGQNIVACTDGVGTKIQLLRDHNRLHSVGFDLVAMCVNDLYCCGATPAFFLDYISCGKLEKTWYDPVVGSIAEACKQTGMALLGGETAEHPGVMPEDDFDLAGFCIGFQPPEHMLPLISEIKSGDVLLGLPSSGLHSNGFSLVRKVLANLKEQNSSRYQKLLADEAWLDSLLAPTRIYTEIPAMFSHIKGLVHVTGGGLYENVPRILPEGLGALIEQPAVFNKDIFDFFREFTDEKDLYGVFNMGIGMVLVCSAGEAETLQQKHTELQRIGEVTSSNGVVLAGIDT